MPAHESALSASMSERAALNAASPALDDYTVIRRNGAVVLCEPSKISVAMTKAMLAVHGEQSAASARVRKTVHQLTRNVVNALIRSRPHGGTFHIKDIQDQVELALKRAGEHHVARAYVLYREQRAQARQASATAAPKAELHVLDDGVRRPLDLDALTALIAQACEGLGAAVKPEPIIEQTLKNLYEGAPLKQIYDSAILAARTLIEQEPAYSRAAARILLHILRREALGKEVTHAQMAARYARYFPVLVQRGARLELPQTFPTRVAMGLALNEADRNARAVEFYHLLSRFDFMSSPPTLFNAGTRRSQLSSCYLTTVADDLEGIYEALKENALLSKFAGGLGNDWTRVRALGAHIQGTNGKSQGVVPFLKVVNDTAVAVNQGGKRKGAVCAYLETWHLDIEEFLELRKNTGDDRRRAHDMNTANWIPELFM